jgi:hypothetical protein
MSLSSRLLRAHRPSLTACVVVAALAAPASGQTFEVGARAGLNLSNVTSVNDEGNSSLDWRPALVAGGFLTWRGFGWIELQPEVLYSSKGAKISEEELASHLILDYVEIPVLARVSRAAGSRRFYAAAGPYVGIRLRAKARTEFSGATEELDLSDDLERRDFGLAIGGGVEAGRLVIDGRYTFGLSDIDALAPEGTDVKNRTVSITAGFRF